MPSNRDYGIRRSRPKGIAHGRNLGAIRVGLRRGEVKRARAKPNVHASKVFTREGTAQFNTEGYAEDMLRRTRP